MNQAATCADDDRIIPGELMSMVAGNLSGLGFRVQPPPHPDARDLTISGIPGIPSSRLHVDDTGEVEWDYPAPEDGNPDPRKIADMVTAVLTGKTGQNDYLGRGYGNPRMTIKGIVGLELKARGLSVELSVYEDEECFNPLAEIVVTMPGAGGQSQVIVADDGSVTWINDYWDEFGEALWEPPWDQWLTGKDVIARDIADTLKRAISAAETKDDR